MHTRLFQWDEGASPGRTLKEKQIAKGSVACLYRPWMYRNTRVASNPGVQDHLASPHWGAVAFPYWTSPGT